MDGRLADGHETAFVPSEVSIIRFMCCVDGIVVKESPAGDTPMAPSLTRKGEVVTRVMCLTKNVKWGCNLPPTWL